MSTVIEGIARITREMGLDAVIVGEGNASRHILQNVDEWDAGLHEAIKLNLDGYTQLSRRDAFFITAGGAYGLSPFMGEGGYDGVISLRGPGEWDSYESLGKALGEIGRSHGVKTCGFTAVDMNAKVYLDIAAHAGFELRELDDDPFAVLRSKHTEREIEKITRAQRIAEEALELLIPKIVPGAVELELRQELIGTMISLGASGPSCRLLGSGKATGESHAQATAKKIEKGDAVVIDFGAIFDDYNSDMTRTFFVGSATDEQKFHYNLVLEAQQAAIDAFKVGALGREVHEAAVKVFAREGLAEYFTHGIGHNVGIDIHELPWCNEESEDVMEEGYAMTIEPGLYFKDKYGIRLEDTLYLGPNGKENLTKAPKELTIL